MLRLALWVASEIWNWISGVAGRMTRRDAGFWIMVCYVLVECSSRENARLLAAMILLAVAVREFPKELRPQERGEVGKGVDD